MNLPASGVSGDPPPTGVRRRPLRALVAILAAVCCLAVAIGAGTAAHAELARKPTPAELSAAAAAAVAGRPGALAAAGVAPAGVLSRTQPPGALARRRGGRSGPAPRASRLPEG